MTVKEAIERSALELNNVENPIREARMLICLATGLSLEEVIVKEDRCMSSEQAEAFNKVLARRVAGEPFAYIAGEKEFMGLTFSVNKDVLIPRPDTELLVNMAAGRETTVLDLCTGSGCVAVSLARLMPWAEVTAA
ncbi:MAG: peptide chain release factor N(5)-glutamine methyltransferase, partial [Bacillota bacterium]|nr:peptide chain release factor N(5)-glutamine methyltransferase [Bacillota bacterium]